MYAICKFEQWDGAHQSVLLQHLLGWRPNVGLGSADSDFRRFPLPTMMLFPGSITERNRERCRRRKGSNRPHVVSGCPTGDVASPEIGAIGVRRINFCQRVVPRHMVHHRHQNRADEIEQATDE